MAGDAVRLLEPTSEADPAALLVQFLIAFGNAAGRCPYFTVEADVHHSNEFVVQVGETSKGRKGTSWGQVRSLLQRMGNRGVIEECPPFRNGHFSAIAHPIHIAIVLEKAARMKLPLPIRDWLRTIEAKQEVRPCIYSSRRAPNSI